MRVVGVVIMMIDRSIERECKRERERVGIVSTLLLL